MNKRIILVLTIVFALSGCSFRSEIVRVPDGGLYNQSVTFNNARYISILRFCDYYNLDWDWDLVSQRIEIKKDASSVVLRPDSDLALVNNKSVKLDNPIEYKEGVAYIPVTTAIFVSEDIFGLKRPTPTKKTYQIKTIVIDPGHGGKNIGAVGKYGTKEKDIVLDISKRLKRNLEKQGLTVYLTRDRDKPVSLYKRTAFANGKNADLFISVHANASRYSRARGFEVYYLSEATNDNARALAAAENASLNFEEEIAGQDEASPPANPTAWDLLLSEHRRESKELAYYIYNMTADNLDMKKRGVKGARFVVLKGAIMPAVLIEVGFLTNRREESKLRRTSFRGKIADLLSCSILAYKKEYERTDGWSR
ncbi:MAG: N-acetylmuramoyl-L-alanine amidase [Candidatus Omnitrophota bacterium]|nr:MAG: N-acetylmuramoyl-L-alanine amidase [Candidatus Omnitrophota bacterium]